MQFFKKTQNRKQLTLDEGIVYMALTNRDVQIVRSFASYCIVGRSPNMEVAKEVLDKWDKWNAPHKPTGKSHKKKEAVEETPEVPSDNGSEPK